LATNVFLCKRRGNRGGVIVVQHLTSRKDRPILGSLPVLALNFESATTTASLLYAGRFLLSDEPYPLLAAGESFLVFLKAGSQAIASPQAGRDSAQLFGSKRMLRIRRLRRDTTTNPMQGTVRSVDPRHLKRDMRFYNTAMCARGYRQLGLSQLTPGTAVNCVAALRFCICRATP